MLKTQIDYLFGLFELLNFEFVLDFDIRISDFPMPQTCLVLTMLGRSFMQGF